MLVVAGHVEHGDVGKGMSCPHDAFDSAVDIASKYDEIGGHFGQLHLADFSVQVAENSDAHNGKRDERLAVAV